LFAGHRFDSLPDIVGRFDEIVGFDALDAHRAFSRDLRSSANAIEQRRRSVSVLASPSLLPDSLDIVSS
jgi:hypothetical protein